MALIQEHPLFAEHKTYYEQYEHFYKGGDLVEANQKYLPQHPFESDTQYKLRLQLATYKNHCKPIVSVFSSSVWRRQPTREISSSLEQYLENVDGVGTSENVFFQDLSTKMAAYGVYFVLVDASKAPDEVDILSKRDADSFGIRPVFVPVSPLDVIAWNHNSIDDMLDYIVVRERAIRNTTGDVWGDYETIEQYKIWYRDRWELWELGDTQTAGFLKVDEGLHPCGQVPIVAGYFKKKYEMVGESCFAEVLSLIKRAYIFENTLDKSLFDTAFPQQAFFGFDAEDVKNYIRSSSNGLVTPDSSARSEYIEPSGRSFSALLEKIVSDERAIREISLRMVRTGQINQAESAESKKLDKQQLDGQLAVFSHNCTNFEVNCWKMFCRWLELSDAEIEKINIKYNDDFDVEKISAELLKALIDMRRTGDISRSTYWEILKQGEIPLPEDFDPVEEQARIEADNRSNSSFSMISNKFLTGTKTKSEV